jgi:hypothetical protein
MIGSRRRLAVLAMLVFGGCAGPQLVARPAALDPATPAAEEAPAPPPIKLGREDAAIGLARILKLQLPAQDHSHHHGHQGHLGHEPGKQSP